MHALILMTVLAQWAPREAPHYGHVRESRRMGNRSLVGQGYAFFEAFPLSGAGTTSACSTTAPTGAKGEVLTFTRTGNATCSKKGLATTGIADGDLVVLSSNVARVEPDSDGVLGLRVEGARTNSFLRSQEFDNAAWAGASTGAALPTITGDQATAPDGTLTAERVQFPATTAGQFSGIQPAVNVHTAATWTDSYYVKGNGGSGTLDLCMYDGAAYTCTTCAYVAASWTRCAYAATGSASGFSYIGNMSSVNGGTARSANDVYLWGAQAEAGAYATSYIPTVAAAVTRNAEATPYFSTSTATLAASGSAAATLTSLSSATGSAAFGVMGLSTTSGGRILYRSTGMNVNDGTTVVGAVCSTVACFAAGVASRLSSNWSSAANGLQVRSGQGSAQGAFDGAMGQNNVVVVGGEPSLTSADGIISRVCLDPDPTRCR